MNIFFWCLGVGAVIFLACLGYVIYTACLASNALEDFGIGDE